MNNINLGLIYYINRNRVNLDVNHIRKRGNRMKIFLDAGHSVGGGDTGAEGYNLKEQDITFGIVMLLAKKLSDVGFDIMVSSC